MITNNCETCDPCKGCDADIRIENGQICNPCASCEPCVISEKCSWCGNGFYRCDTMMEDTEGFGVMHPSCVELERAAFKQSMEE
ncbi:MAG: hypothetical protein ABR985_13230 [Methanotrichaceae archaeon]|jgi:hypothetical protein